MKTKVGTYLLAGLCLTWTGCIGVSIGGRREPPSPPVIIPGTPISPADAATMAEIDAAARLSFDNQKLDTLTQIARRPGLNPMVQVHLVNTAYRSLSFDNQKAALLKTIIASPDFNDTTRHAIVTQLQKISFDNIRRDILDAINQRMTVQ